MDNQLQTCCGSPAYAAPELVAGKEYLGAEVCAQKLFVVYNKQIYPELEEHIVS